LKADRPSAPFQSWSLHIEDRHLCRAVGCRCFRREMLRGVCKLLYCSSILAQLISWLSHGTISNAVHVYSSAWPATVQHNVHGYAAVAVPKSTTRHARQNCAEDSRLTTDAEARKAIHAYCQRNVHHELKQRRSRSTTPRRRRRLSLTQTCKQIRAEFTPLGPF
jgi:primosomal protein N'